ncbi:MAG: type I deoxyribonuclease HsdR [Fimbriimonadales bacterium]|nr:MAG: type I deoxyribonuclease HsdR [Fimbriimonadales bacterium]
MSIGAERSAVQSPFLRYAQEAGWTYLPPEEATRLRRGETGLVLYEVLVRQLQALNPGVVDLQRAEDVAGRVVRVRPNIEGNLEAWEFLKGLKTVFVAEEKRERNVRLLDPSRTEANSFHVTDELPYQSGTRRIRLDLVFFVNGIPVVVVETKASKRLDGMVRALEQIRRYHEQGPELMALAQLYALTHLVQFLYAATWSLSPKDLFNWRDEVAADFETLVKTFIAPSRVLRVLTEFILFVRRDGDLSKAVLRPHQMRAVERVLQRARDPKKRRALVWHTQGSGKTYTMITVARRLIQDPVFQNPTVLMLVDRNELEQQLFTNLEAVGFGHAEVAASKRHLQELLRADRRGLIVSTIQKFEGMPANICTRTNVFVLVDEAHRTTGADLGNYLMGALPNATYVGFTGTPIDRTAYGKGTFKVFGVDDPPHGYLDRYSIRQSIADGTTVPLHYALAPNELKVDREVLEREFLTLTELEGVSDVEDINRVLERAVTLKNMLKSPERMERIAVFVADHFHKTIEPMGYKAFLVAVDREGCCRYKALLDRHLPPEYSAVVISPAADDPPELRAHHLSEDEERRVRDAFRRPDQLPKVLIVTEKLLTGFDAPILYCMYLDKPMRDHVLLQAIARVNRPYEDESGRRKPSGFVLDFVGIFDNLERALAFDSKDIEGVVVGLDVLKDRFRQLLERGRMEFLGMTTGLAGDKAVEVILEGFRDADRRDEFYRYFRELQDVYEILSPDEFLRPFIEDYQRLSEIYQILRASYEARPIASLDFLKKTARLVQERTQGSIIRGPEAVYGIDADTLRRLASENRPDAVKVFNLLKAVRQIVEQQASEQPYLIPIGERAEAIVRAFGERQITTQEALRQLVEGPLDEIQKAEQARRASDLSPEVFTIYWLLERDGIQSAETTARKIGSVLEQHRHWLVSERHEREVRKGMYKALLEAGVDEPVPLADRLLQILRRSRE